MRLYHEFDANLERQAGEYAMPPAARVHARAGQLGRAGFPGRRDASCSGSRRAARSIATASATERHVVPRHLRAGRLEASSSKLTLNLGLRYDYEGATTEIENRNIRGFDPNAILSITAAAEASYAANPIPQVPASAWKARGGVVFASDERPRHSGTPTRTTSSRASASPTSGTTRRSSAAGWASTRCRSSSHGINQMGYSQSTPITASQDAA